MAVNDRINGLLGSVAIKPPCRVATTANITLSGLQTIDGVTVVAGDRVLVKDQTTATENGIYEADTSAWSRAKDFNGNRDAVQGTTIPVYAGTVNGGMYYQVTNANPITIGTTSLTFDNALASTAGMISLTQGGSVQDAIKYVTPQMFGAVGDGTTDDTTALNAAIAACNTSGLLMRIFEGEFKTTDTLTQFDNAPGIIAESSGYVVFRHYATTDCIIAKGSYKRFENFRMENMSAPGSGTSGHALLHVKNCAYGYFKDIYTAHDLDNYSGFLLEQVYDGADDAYFLVHLGCWYNEISQVYAIYKTFGETRGYGVHLKTNSNALSVVNPPGESAGTYSGSVSNNIISGCNIEGKINDYRFENNCDHNTVTKGQLLGGNIQVRIIDGRHNTFRDVKFNQWAVNPFQIDGSRSGRNLIDNPILFALTSSPWSLGTLTSTDVVRHVGEGVADVQVFASAIDCRNDTTPYIQSGSVTGAFHGKVGKVVSGQTGYGLETSTDRLVLKAPLLEYYNAADALIFTAGAAIGARLPVFTTTPDTTGWNSAQAGLEWYNTTTNKKQFWNGSAVETVTSA